MEETGAFGYWCRAVELAAKLLLIQAVRTGIWNTRGEEKGKKMLSMNLENERERGCLVENEEREKPDYRSAENWIRRETEEWVKKEKQIMKQQRRGMKDTK